MNAVEFVRKFGWDEAAFALKSPSGLDCYADIEIELKRLVESYELVEKHGGIEGAKDYLKGRFIQHHMSAFSKIKKAIADVEKCQ